MTYRARVAVCMAPFLLIAASLLNSVARAETTDTYLGLKFPSAIAGFARGTSKDYETRNPGLGYSYSYNRQGWIMTVYIYDKGRPDISDGVSSPLVVKEFDLAKGDITQVKNAGVYSKADWVQDIQIKASKDSADLSCAVYDIVFAQSGKRLDSFLCLAGWHGKFFKVRISGPDRREAEAAAAEWAKHLVAVN